MNSKRKVIPHPHDVLCGRGIGLKKHEGNIKFRRWVNEYKTSYILCDSNAEKTEIVEIIIRKVQNQHPPGRFLCRREGRSTYRDINDGEWVLAGALKAEARTKQCLRDGAQMVRSEHNVPQKRNCKMLRDEASIIMQNLKANKTNRTHQIKEPAMSSFVPSGYYPNTTSHLSSSTDIVKSNISTAIIQERDLWSPLDPSQQQSLTQVTLQQQGPHQLSAVGINVSQSPTNININISLGQASSQEASPSVTSQYSGSIVNTGDNGQEHMVADPSVQETQYATSVISKSSQKEQQHEMVPGSYSELLIHLMKTQQKLIDLQGTLLESFQKREDNVAANLSRKSRNVHLEKDDEDNISRNVVATGDLSDHASLKDCQCHADDNVDDIKSFLSQLLSSDKGIDHSSNMVKNMFEPTRIRETPTTNAGETFMQEEHEALHPSLSRDAPLTHDTNSSPQDKAETFTSRPNGLSLQMTSLQQQQPQSQTENNDHSQQLSDSWLYSWAPPLDETIQNQLEYTLPFTLALWSFFGGFSERGVILCIFIPTVHTIQSAYTNFGPETKAYRLKSAFITPEAHMWIDCVWISTLAFAQMIWPHHFGGLVNPLLPYCSGLILLILMIIYVIISYRTIYHKLEVSKQKKI